MKNMAICRMTGSPYKVLFVIFLINVLFILVYTKKPLAEPNIDPHIATILSEMYGEKKLDKIKEIKFRWGPDIRVHVAGEKSQLFEPQIMETLEYFSSITGVNVSKSKKLVNLIIYVVNDPYKTVLGEAWEIFMKHAKAPKILLNYLREEAAINSNVLMLNASVDDKFIATGAVLVLGIGDLDNKLAQTVIISQIARLFSPKINRNLSIKSIFNKNSELDSNVNKIPISIKDKEIIKFIYDK